MGGTPKSGKVRERSPQSGDEIISARDRYKSALQDLLPHSEDDSDISDDELWASKSKRLAIQKKRQLNEKQSDQDINKYVMKLFDRSVDLAQFNEVTPLYPICRAWIANQPHQTYNIKKEPSTPEIKEEPGYVIPKDTNDFDAVRDTYKLPPPERPTSKFRSSRIPEQKPYVTNFTTMMQEGVEPPSREDILQDNLQHWSKVRKSWMEASAKNDLRYEKSIRLLTAMYNKAQRLFQN